MKSRRIAWLLLTLAAAAAYFFENQTGTRVLLAVLLPMPLLSAALLRLPRGELRVSLAFPETLERGQEGELTLLAESTRRLSLPIRAELCLYNRMTGEENRLPVSAIVPGRGKAEQKYELSTPHCGAVELRLTRLRAVGLFGLDSREISTEAAGTYTVLPKLRPVEVYLAETADFLSDSQRYSTSRPGYDPSETFRIREYLPGDPIRQIHWKLTEKLDQLQVRDFGLPLVERMLLLMETTDLSGNRPDPTRTDSLLDLLASVSLALSGREISHVLGWQSHESGAYVSREIHGPEDLESVLPELLREPVTGGEASVCGCFARTYARCAYAHAAVFTQSPVPDLSLLFHGNRVTALIPAGTDAEPGLWSAGAELILFTDDISELEL